MTPLWLLHGFLGAPASWTRVVESLEARAGVRAPWLFGHGQPPRDVPEGFWQAVDALAAELSEPAFVAGYSLGGRLALGIACRHPRRVRGVIAIGAHLGLDSDLERGERIAWETALATKLERAGLPSFVDAWEKLPLFASQAALPAAQRSTQRAVRLSHDAAALARVLTALGTGRMPALEPERAGVPVLLVTGEHDEKLSAVARARPRLRHRIVPDAGHNPLLEAPHALGRLIDEQLRDWSATRTQENHA